MKNLIILLLIATVFSATAQKNNNLTDGVWTCKEFTITFENGIGKSTLFPDEGPICTDDYPSSHCSETKYEFVFQSPKYHSKGFILIPLSQRMKVANSQIAMITKQGNYSQSLNPTENQNDVPFVVRDTIVVYTVVSRTDTKMVLKEEKTTREPKPEFRIYTLIKQ